MRQLKITIGLLAAAALLSCSPEKMEFNRTDTYIPADKMDLVATPNVVNGQNGNEITVENHSPMPSQWTLPQLGNTDKTSSKSCDTFIATHTGLNDIKSVLSTLLRAPILRPPFRYKWMSSLPSLTISPPVCALARRALLQDSPMISTRLW